MTKAELQAAYDALKAEADAMRAELAVHRAHACAFFGPTAYGPQCTCGTTVRCAKHHPADWGQIFVNTACAAGYNPVQVWQNTAAAQPTVIEMIAAPAAGAAAQPLVQTYWVTT